MGALASVAKGLVGRIYLVSGLPRRVHRGRLVILCYRRVVPAGEMERGLYQPGMITEKNRFRAQMDYVARHYEVVPLERLAAEEFDFPPGERQLCAITFDDGWRDNYDHAMEILVERELPATVFLSTALIGTRDRFWPERLAAVLDRAPRASGAAREMGRVAGELGVVPEPLLSCLSANAPEQRRRRYDSAVEQLKSLPPSTLHELVGRFEGLVGVEESAAPLMLDWTQVREMARSGFAFGSHGHTHSILTGLDDRALGYELEAGARTLTDHELPFLPIFCYPNGDYDGRVIRRVREAGYRWALTTRPRHNPPKPAAPHELRRICIHDDLGPSLGHFAVHLSGLLQRGAPVEEAEGAPR
jgi:peptidoglycan/xylan/chitin deacetylase (PgdA/CDA1 family)